MESKLPPISITIILLPLFFLTVIWGVYWLDWSHYLQLYQYGVYPNRIKGLRGIVFSPFIHGGLRHLYNNSVALLALLVMLQYFYKNLVWKVLFWGILLSGLGTWLLGRENYHIGASGLIYVLVSFMFFKGLLSKYYRLVALSLLIVVFYGSMVWYMFPDAEEGISWEGHLSGFLTGLVLTLFLKSPAYAQKTYKYEWQRPDYNPETDAFMNCFDSDGNFIIIPNEVKESVEEVETKWKTDFSNPYRRSLPVHYTLTGTGTAGKEEIE